MARPTKEQINEAGRIYREMVGLCQNVQNGLVLQLLANVAADTIVHGAQGDMNIIDELKSYLTRHLNEFVPPKEMERKARQERGD